MHLGLSFGLEISYVLQNKTLYTQSKERMYEPHIQLSYKFVLVTFFCFSLGGDEVKFLLFIRAMPYHVVRGIKFYLI